MSSTRTTSIVFPYQAFSLAPIIPFARILQRLGSGRLWLGQSQYIETHQVFAALAGAGIRIPFGSSVALWPLRHPVEAAVQARSIARLSGFPFVAGIGPGSPEFQASVRSAPLDRPVAATSDYVTAMRALLNGERLHADAAYYSSHTILPHVEAAPVECGLGVLRPAMARAAGRVADVAITWLAPPHYLREVLLPRMHEGAEAAGRLRPRLVSIVHVAVERPGRDLIRIAHAATHAHLGAAHYRDMLRMAGLPLDPDDAADSAELLLESGTFVAGTVQQVAEGLEVYRRLGVDEVVINLCGVSSVHGLDAALADAVDILIAAAAA